MSGHSDGEFSPPRFQPPSCCECVHHKNQAAESKTIPIKLVMNKSKYHLVTDESLKTGVQVQPPRHKKAFVKKNVILTTTLAASILLNTCLLWKTIFRNSIGPVSRSLYGKKSYQSPQAYPHIPQSTKITLAGLLNDVDIPYKWNTEYSGPNYTEVNELWYSDTEADKGVIAVDKSYAAKLNLPPSQSFPWDETKKFYVTNGHHALHCLVSTLPISILPCPTKLLLASNLHIPRPIPFLPPPNLDVAPYPPLSRHSSFRYYLFRRRLTSLDGRYGVISWRGTK